MKRGQVAITDLFLALLLFVVVLGGLSLFWNIYQSRQDDILIGNEIELASFQIVDSLIRTQGYPRNWEEDPSSVETLGFVSSDRVLSPEKIVGFQNLTYNQTKELLKIKEFEYRLIIANETTTILDTNQSMTGRVVSIRRYVTYEGRRATFDFRLGQ